MLLDPAMGLPHHQVLNDFPVHHSPPSQLLHAAPWEKARTITNLERRPRLAGIFEANLTPFRWDGTVVQSQEQRVTLAREPAH